MKNRELKLWAAQLMLQDEMHLVSSSTSVWPKHDDIASGRKPVEISEDQARQLHDSCGSYIYYCIGSNSGDDNYDHAHIVYMIYTSSSV